MTRLNVAAKIWLSVGIFAGGYVLTAAVGQIEGLQTEREIGAATEVLFPAAQRAQDAEASFQATVKGMQDAVMTQDRPTFSRAQDEGARVMAALREIQAMPGLAAERSDSTRRLAESVERYLSDGNRTYGAVVADPGRIATEGQAMGDLAARAAQLQAALRDGRRPFSDDLRVGLTAARERSARQRRLTLAAFLLTLLFAGVAVAVTIRRSIMAPIVSAFHGFQAAAENTASASDSMRQSGETVARHAAEQASYTQETAASLEEISVTTKVNAERAGDADRMMVAAQQTIQDAGCAMENLTKSMEMISNSSRQVAEVLQSIDEISFHTNILALNAAVEAARAGAAGAGFSVVADEVRSLARRAADAAKRSADIIEKTIQDVKSGVEWVSVAREAFSRTAGTITDGSRAVSEIASASAEQARGIEHVGQAIARIETVTQSNAANARETAEAALNVTEQVQATRKHLRELAAVIGLG